MDPQKLYDVLIIGGGNAALCAAITARQAGASVLVLEAADEIGLAVVATTATLVAVFAPTGFMPGVVGEFFKCFAIACWLTIGRSVTG